MVLFVVFFLQLLEGIATLAVELEVIFMELEERGSVRDSEKRDAKFSSLGIENVLHIQRDGARAFIQDSELRFMVEEASHGDSLLLASAKHFLPVVIAVQTSFSLD